jgi:hypothetical protein
VWGHMTMELLGCLMGDYSKVGPRVARKAREGCTNRNMKGL